MPCLHQHKTARTPLVDARVMDLIEADAHLRRALHTGATPQQHPHLQAAVQTVEQYAKEVGHLVHRVLGALPHENVVQAMLERALETKAMLALIG